MERTDNFDELQAIVRLLAEASFRDLSPTCSQQRFQTALWLHRRGYTVGDVGLLWRYCKDKGQKPEGLFASSFGNPTALAKRLNAAQQWSLTQLEDAPSISQGNLAPVFALKSGRRQA